MLRKWAGEKKKTKKRWKRDKVKKQVNFKEQDLKFRQKKRCASTVEETKKKNENDKLVKKPKKINCFTRLARRKIGPVGNNEVFL